MEYSSRHVRSMEALLSACSRRLGWEAGIRTPIPWSRAMCPTVGRPPSRTGTTSLSKRRWRRKSRSRSVPVHVLVPVRCRTEGRVQEQYVGAPALRAVLRAEAEAPRAPAAQRHLRQRAQALDLLRPDEQARQQRVARGIAQQHAGGTALGLERRAALVPHRERLGALDQG